jgi:serine/threonine protein phosphatase 1
MRYKHTPWISAPERVRISKEEKEIVVGDVHGMSESFQTLLDGIANSCETKEYNLTFLGDLIDRGPDSLGCLKIASKQKEAYKSVTRILGNHEIMMLFAILNRLDELERHYFHSIWTMNGGDKVVSEIYAALGKDPQKEHIRDLSAALKSILGTDCWNDLYHSFLPTENRMHKGTHKRVGNLILTHAGINPYIENVGQNVEGYFSESGKSTSDRSWPWIRDTFLYFNEEKHLPENSFVIHGHTPTYEYINWIADIMKNGPKEWPHKNRICLDAASFKTTILLALEICDGMFRFHFSFDEKKFKIDLD